jgi:UDP-N-acetylmuramate-alanine ligase
MVFIPRLSVAKTVEGEGTRMDGEALAALIRQNGKEVRCVPDDEMLVSQIIKIAREGDVIVFLGSHGFRGMIEATLEALQSS